MIRTAFVVVALAATTCASAQTTQINPNRYRVESGVAFELLSFGVNDFLFAWSDSSGSFSGLADPTLELVAGQTYTFQRFSSSHPFAICNDSLPVTGEDGDYFRTTFDGTAIDNATLQPIDDFTADPGPTTDMIVWTPTSADVGVYYYTCTITGHPAMTGRIEIIELTPPCPADTNGDGMLSPADFTAWIAAFNAMAPECDQNGDGSCTPADFTAWIANYNAGC